VRVWVAGDSANEVYARIKAFLKLARAVAPANVSIRYSQVRDNGGLFRPTIRRKRR
jgi:hypothetical protein